MTTHHASWNQFERSDNQIECPNRSCKSIGQIRVSGEKAATPGVPFFPCDNCGLWGWLDRQNPTKGKAGWDREKEKEKREQKFGIKRERDSNEPVPGVAAAAATQPAGATPIQLPPQEPATKLARLDTSNVQALLLQEWKFLTGIQEVIRNNPDLAVVKVATRAKSLLDVATAEYGN